MPICDFGTSKSTPGLARSRTASLGARKTPHTSEDLGGCDLFAQLRQIEQDHSEGKSSWAY
jgi:hypothetical protein